jgi:quinol monooxygenase YgiN
MLVIHATFPVDPDRRDEAADLFRGVAERSRAEEGVLDYHVAEDLDDPGVFRFLERYEDEAAFGAHGESDHVADLQAALPDLLADEPEVVRFEVTAASELDL